MYEDNKVLAVIILSFIFGIIFIIWGAIAISKKSCLESYAEYKPQFGVWSGCRVEWNGKITPVDIIREIR